MFKNILDILANYGMLVSNITNSYNYNDHNYNDHDTLASGRCLQNWFPLGL